MADGKLILAELAAAVGAEEGHAKFVPLLRVLAPT